MRITTDDSTTTGDENTTLQPVPLQDTYDTNKLEFVSAIPVQNNVTANGSVGYISWDDIGPIYPGGTSTVALLFNVLEPPNNSSNMVTNTAMTVNAKFQNGWNSNNATDEVVTVTLPTGSIGDFVWRDIDGLGDQNGGAETGIANVSVVLTPPASVDLGNGAGNPITNVTDRNGGYLFEGLPASGNYTVTVLTATLPGSTFTNTYDEDSGTTSPDNTTVVNLTHDAANGLDNHLSADFGYQVPSTIDGLIWHDLDRSADATHDTGEPWLTNVTVSLVNSSGTTIATTQTDSDGYFLFVGSYSGIYTVLVNNASGQLNVGTWTQSFDTDGLETADRAAVNVTYGGTAHTDYSYYQTGTYDIGDTLFYDWDGDAVQDSHDEGMPNVTVKLYYDANSNGIIDTATDGFIMSDVTDSSGNYLFENLPNGAYIVEVDETDPQFPSHYLQTLDPDESGVATNPNNTGSSIINNSDDLSIDFAYQPSSRRGLPVSIGDTVWVDINGDGLQAGSQEVGIANITITLYADFDGDGIYVAISNTTTDTDGLYLFDDLPAGNYRIDVDTSDNDLPKDSFNNAYVATTATQITTTMTEGSAYLDADFGFVALGAIGDTIFWDSNSSGSQDWNETGISNVTVNLYYDENTNGFYDTGTDTLVDTKVTDTNGLYMFTQLAATNYIVVVDTNSTIITNSILMSDPDADGVPAPEVPASNLPAGADSETGVQLVIGQNFMGADFGYLPSGIIGDTVWIDSNDDGIRDATEIGIPYITIELLTNGIKVAETETDADGYYIFDNLEDATYTVVVKTSDTDFPANLTQSYDPDNTLDNTGSMIVMTDQTVVSIGGIPGTDINLDVDFGYRYSGTNVLSGTIGLDGIVQDGLMGNTDSGVNADESPFPGAYVFIYVWDDLNGDDTIDLNETMFVDSTTTAANGDYQFEDLPDDSVYDGYIVSLTAPAAHLFLTTTNGATPATLLSETTNSFGEFLTGYQLTTISSVTTNIDFAFETRFDYDFGDLPSSYNTLLENYLGVSGARHQIPASTTLYLGGAPDTEPNGQPTLTAIGDGADEDGLVGISNWVDGVDGGEISIKVGAGTGWLVVWVDFDQNGDFKVADEMIINQAVNSTGGDGNDGVYTFTFDVPSGTMSSTDHTILNSRFRLFEDQPLFPALSFSGEATNGEVEDYQFDFPPPTLVRLISFNAFENGSDIIVEWKTDVEMGTVGFFLERLTENGTYERINTILLSSPPFAHETITYHLIDPGVSVGDTVTYRLIELENTGRLRYLGPYTITIGTPGLNLDEWSRRYFTDAELNDPSISGGNADPDGDGHSNDQERLSGTHPRNRHSVLQLSGIDHTGGVIVVRWLSESNRFYTVESTTNQIGHLQFRVLATDIPATPPENSYNDTVEHEGRTLYRIRLMQ